MLDSRADEIGCCRRRKFDLPAEISLTQYRTSENDTAPWLANYLPEAAQRRYLVQVRVGDNKYGNSSRNAAGQQQCCIDVPCADQITNTDAGRAAYLIIFSQFIVFL